MHVISTIAVGLLFLTLAGMVLRNAGGTAQVINSVTGGYANLLSSARGSTK